MEHVLERAPIEHESKAPMQIRRQRVGIQIKLHFGAFIVTHVERHRLAKSHHREQSRRCNPSVFI